MSRSPRTPWQKPPSCGPKSQFCNQTRRVSYEDGYQITAFRCELDLFSLIPGKLAPKFPKSVGSGGSRTRAKAFAKIFVLIRLRPHPHPLSAPPSPTMSSEDVGTAPSVDKGKARARIDDPDERTPLLASGSGPHYDLEPGTPRRRRLFTKLLSVFLLTFSLCILFLVLVLLIAYSYGSRASGISSDELIQRALVARGPDRLDVLNITTDGGIWLHVQGRVGLDAGGVIGVATEEDDSVLQYWWKSIGRWGIHQFDRVTVDLTAIDVSSEHDQLAVISLPPLELPLTADPPNDDSWLTTVAIPVYFEPTKNISAIARFVRESWRDGTMRVEAHVGRAVVRGGRLNDGSWRTRLRAIRSDVHSTVSMKSKSAYHSIPIKLTLRVSSPSAWLPTPGEWTALSTGFGTGYASVFPYNIRELSLVYICQRHRCQPTAAQCALHRGADPFHGFAPAIQ